MSTVLIRDAKLSDAPRLLEIYSYYVKNTAITFEYNVPSLEEFRHRMKNITLRYPYIVLEAAGKVMGYAYAGSFIGRAAYDWSCEMTVYLDRTAKKLGFGRKIYEAMEQRLKDMGILNLYACIGYIDKEDEYLNHNSAELMRDINTDPEMFYAAVLNMLQLASELCVSLILVGYLLVKDALLTLGVAFAMVVMVFIFMKKLRRTLARFGDDRRKYNANILQCMQQAFGGIKEIKIANREAYFEGEFVKQNGLYTYVIKQNSFLSSIPKPIMEALCITGLMAAIIVRINATSTSPEQFVGTLAVFAAAAFALLPSANKMSEYLGSIIHNGVVIHKIGEEYAAIRDMEIQTEKEENYKKVTLDKEIKVEDMTFHYPDTEDAVLAHVNVTIPKNKSVAFIGPSGAGKTTMVDLILGVLKPQAGKITVDGMDIKESNRGWHDKIGYIPQTIYMLDDTIRNNIAFGKVKSIDDAEIWAALKQAQLDEFVK